MDDSKKDHRRLLLHFGRHLQEINRAVINPVMDRLDMADLKPIMGMVAHARADYLKALFSLASNTHGERAPEDVASLRKSREVYDELIAAVTALETMIERGYLDVGAGAG